MIYLLHFSRPYKHAQHYLGYTKDLDTRIKEHQSGKRGARLIQVIQEKGIEFCIARVWNGDRKLERHLKRKKCNPRLCPICGAKGRR